MESLLLKLLERGGPVAALLGLIVLGFIKDPPLLVTGREYRRVVADSKRKDRIIGEYRRQLSEIVRP